MRTVPRCLLTLLAVLAALMMAAWPAAAQESTVSRNTITVSGEAQLQVVPDRAVVTAGIVVQQSTASEAVREVSRIARRVLEEVERLGIPKEQVQTSLVSLRPVYSQAQVQVIIGYRAEYSLTIAVDDIDLVGRLIDGAVRAGANVVRGITFGLRSEEIHRLRALQMAVQDARQKAEALAKAAGIDRPLRVIQIIEGQAVVIPRVQVPARVGVAEAVPVEPGLVLVSASVTVVFGF